MLGGTDTFTVDFNGDHLLSYAVSTNSSGGKVTNSGKIAAAGGTVLMTARAAQGVQDAVVNNTGMVEANSVRQENGEIILEADNGTVANSGTLDASGKGAGETGGTVKVLGQQVAVADGAKIDVSGDAGGGTALIGGNLARRRARNPTRRPPRSARPPSTPAPSHRAMAARLSSIPPATPLSRPISPRQGRHHLGQGRHGRNLGPYPRHHRHIGECGRGRHLAARSLTT